MKTDTEDTVRVTITFNRASNPEWFSVISGIANGRARSEIVKTHLTVPLLERFAKNRQRQPEAVFETVKNTVENTVKKEINTSNLIVNSSENYAGAAEQTDGKYDAKKMGDSTKNVNDLSDAPIQRRLGGGLASHLVGNGFRTV